MPNKHFCQGPECHTNPTQDRFLKSRGVVRGRYAYATINQGPNQWGWQASDSDKFFCSQACKNEWLNKNNPNPDTIKPIPIYKIVFQSIILVLSQLKVMYQIL